MTLHAIARAKERYGVDFDLADLREIRDIIRGGYARQITNRDPKGCVAFEVRYCGAIYNVVFGPSTGAILTFLPAAIPVKNHRGARIREVKTIWSRGRRVRYHASL